jgi:hypothetical protein
MEYWGSAACQVGQECPGCDGLHQPDGHLAGAKAGKFLQCKTRLGRRSVDQSSTVAANPQVTFATMSAYRHEAAKACAPNPAILERASGGAGYARGDHGVVGVGVRDQRMAAEGPQISGGPGSLRLSRKATRSRRTDFLPLGPVAIETPGEATKIPSWIGR